ncbi:unnamed protein product [Vicia faba]|uniref:Uncharacterized protein n=1 Tax=Vicia faba TaxID=3906 RepID=A0AAV1AWP8_VICFA|nr:unnamed protein product [Vicia faba]
MPNSEIQRDVEEEDGDKRKTESLESKGKERSPKAFVTFTSGFLIILSLVKSCRSTSGKVRKIFRIGGGSWTQTRLKMSLRGGDESDGLKDEVGAMSCDSRICHSDSVMVNLIGEESSLRSRDEGVCTGVAEIEGTIVFLVIEEDEGVIRSGGLRG